MLPTFKIIEPTIRSNCVLHLIILHACINECTYQLCVSDITEGEENLQKLLKNLLAALEIPIPEKVKELLISNLKTTIDNRFLSDELSANCHH